MKELGLFLTKKTANKAMIYVITGISKSITRKLKIKQNSQLIAKELHLIAWEINIEPYKIIFVKD